MKWLSVTITILITLLLALLIWASHSHQNYLLPLSGGLALVLILDGWNDWFKIKKRREMERYLEELQNKK